MQTDPAIYTDFNSLTALKKGAREQSPQAIKQVARQFESLFVQMMLKSMRDTVPENELFGSNAEKMYQDMYDKQLSLQIANGRGIGLAKVIERQLGGKTDAELKDAGIKDAELNEYTIENYLQYSRTATERPGNERTVSEPFAQQMKSAVSLSKLTESAAERKTASSAADAESTSAWQSADEFIDDVWPHALRAGQALGVDADVLLAQSALETGWGKHLPLKEDGSNSFNLFGIKADHRWQGEQVEITTREYRHGALQQEKAAFRAYDSVADAVADYVDFISDNPRYQRALEHGYDAQSYASELQKAGYATDPEYANKISRIRGNEELQNRVSELKNFNKVPLT